MGNRAWIVRASQDTPEYMTDMPHLVRLLLMRQGVQTKEDADIFLMPDYDKDTHDPFLLKDMEKAVDRVISATKNNEHIAIFGDYDADGICGSVVWHDFFRAIDYPHVEYYIPHRYEEGYGLKMKHIDLFSEHNVKLLITIDCGVTNYKEIERARELGIDVIVIDHHIVPPEWPPAYAIIDYKHPDDAYPSKYLSGAGLAFKVVQGILARGSYPVMPGWSKWLLDVVAIAAVADMVPLLGENRVLVRYGLTVLSRTRRPGLRELYRVQRMGQEPRITSDTIGFTIAPRINAASRMGHATTGFEFLTTESREEAKWLMSRLESENEDRKKLVETLFAKVRERVLEYKTLPAVLYFGDPSWLPGVLGIVATRLVEEFGRSAFLWGGSPDHIKGSCRTADGIHAVNVMREAGDLLLDFGGHAAAGGFSLDPEHVDAFGKRLEEIIAREAGEVRLPDMVLEAELVPEDVTWETFETVEAFQPFGQENQKPLFLFPAMEVIYVRPFGAGGKHIRMGFRGSKTVWAFKFNAPKEWMSILYPGAVVDVAASFDLNEWNGTRELRLRLEDVREV